jgi:hypothetical protein
MNYGNYGLWYLGQLWAMATMATMADISMRGVENHWYIWGWPPWRRPDLWERCGCRTEPFPPILWVPMFVSICKLIDGRWWERDVISVFFLNEKTSARLPCSCCGLWVYGVFLSWWLKLPGLEGGMLFWLRMQIHRDGVPDDLLSRWSSKVVTCQQPYATMLGNDMPICHLSMGRLR